MSKRIVGTAIVLTWVGMVGWKARDEYFQPELARLAEAASLSLAPGINFYSLTMGGRTIGQATSRLDTLPDGAGFELEDFMNLVADVIVNGLNIELRCQSTLHAVDYSQFSGSLLCLRQQTLCFVEKARIFQGHTHRAGQGGQQAQV